MSRPANALNSGNTNRRFIMLALVMGLIGAVLVYVAFSDGGGGLDGPAGNQMAVVVARADIPARTKITASMVEVKLVSEGDASVLAFADTAQVVGQTTRFPIAATEQVLSTKVVTLSGTGSVAGKSLAFVVPAGKRAMAVTTKEVIGAGGLILPGDYVDILVVYDILFPSDPKNPAELEEAEAYFVHTILQNIEVLAVAQTIVDLVPESTNLPGTDPKPPASTVNGQRIRNTEANPVADAITVTLALTPEQAQKLYIAESNGTIRLIVRPFGEAEERPIDPMIETDLFPRNLPNPFMR